MKTWSASSPPDHQLISCSLLSPVSRLISLSSISPRATMDPKSQTTCSSGMRYASLLMEQHVTLMLLFKLLRPISPSSAPRPITSSGVFSLQGKKNSVFRECYFGSQRHCKLTRLYPACGYTFRVAAHNDIGARCGCRNMFMSADVFDSGNLSTACDVIEQLLSGMGLFMGHGSIKSCNGCTGGLRAHVLSLGRHKKKGNASKTF